VGFHLALADYVAAAAAGGFTLAEVPITWVSAHAREHGHAAAAALFAAHAVTPAQFTCGLGVPGNIAVPPELFAARLADLPAYAALADQAGCHRAALFCDVRRHEGGPLSDAELVDRACTVAGILSRWNISLSLGVIGRSLLMRVGGIWRQIDDAGVGILVDTVSLARAGLGAGWIGALPAGSIGWLRVADAPEGVADADISYGDRLLPGTGRLPLPELITACRRNGYQGPVSVEVGDPGLAKHPPAVRSRLAFTHTMALLASAASA
jgi:sugar phosphate isomerase/epimerase